MKKVTDNIWTWSIFSEEKQLNFNGFYVQLPDDALFIDPPPLSPEDLLWIEKEKRPAMIILTNKDHRRVSEELRERFKAPIWIHKLDEPLLEVRADRTYSNGEKILDELEIVHLPDMKSPGESALYWKKRGVLILGDALIGKVQGALNLLPAEKFADISKAFESVKKLEELEFEMILVGDGEPILANAKTVLQKFINDFKSKK